MTDKLTLTPIGSIRTIYKDKSAAPRQPGMATESTIGEITLLPHRNFEQALHNLSGFERVWIIFWFHKTRGWNPKVLPPRSRKKKGVFATRSPHRPNPIGISVCRLLKVEGLRVIVEDPDLLDGTPVLDIKPYLPATEAFPDSRAGWLDEERTESPGSYEMNIEPRAREQATWLASAHGIHLLDRATDVLSRDPHPHPYKRIKSRPDGTFELSIKSWRVRFRVDGIYVIVTGIVSGYSPGALATAATARRPLHEEEAHREFHRKFGEEGS
jgi:tRNA-Thr(GGU) m(6)t(6)A37 methyltransferase TsaA